MLAALAQARYRSLSALATARSLRPLPRCARSNSNRKLNRCTNPPTCTPAEYPEDKKFCWGRSGALTAFWAFLTAVFRCRGCICVLRGRLCSLYDVLANLALVFHGFCRTDYFTILTIMLLLLFHLLVSSYFRLSQCAGVLVHDFFLSLKFGYLLYIYICLCG